MEEIVTDKVVNTDAPGELHAALAGAGAYDIETAAIVLERVMRDAGVDASEAVQRMRREKPWLFKASEPPAPSATGAPAIEPAGLEHAAARAQERGDRRSVMAYLRLRRGRV